MVGSSKSNRVRWSINCRGHSSLEKMFLNKEIDPDHYSAEGIYESRDLFQQFKFDIFSQHLRDMAETIKSVGGVDNWSGEGK